MPPDFMPLDPDFAVRVRESFVRQGLLRTLAAELTLVAPGEVHVEIPFSPTLTQQHGFLHAGATATIADTANGYAAQTLAPPGSEVLAVEFKINLMAPAVGERFVARGRVLRPGRRLSVCLAEVFARADGREQAIATMLSTITIRTPNSRGERGGS
ncbi:MAG: PaaI family thioesterase [Acidobacteriota bacterium]